MQTSEAAGFCARLGDHLAGCLKATFPGLHSFPEQAANVFRDSPDAGEEPVYVGRKTTAVLILGYAEVAVTCACDTGTTIRVTLTDPKTHLPEVTTQVLPPSDPSVSFDKALLEIMQAVKQMVEPGLQAHWNTLRVCAGDFAQVASAASSYAEYFGSRIKLEWADGGIPLRAFSLVGGGGLAWSPLDRVPHDGELCWLVHAHRASIHLVRMRHMPDYNCGRGGLAYFKAIVISEDPKFNSQGPLLPEKEPQDNRGDLYGVLLPRDAASDILARLAVTVLSLLATEQDRRKTIEGAFGAILAPLTKAIEAKALKA